MALTNLIYDRTSADAARWLELASKMDDRGWNALTAAEQAEWLTDIKGGYNHTDLNRVGTAVAYLGGRFTGLITHLIEYRGIYGVANDALFRVPYVATDVAIDPKTDWAHGDTVWMDQAARYIADISTLRGLLPLTSEFPPAPADAIDLTIEEANDIEKLLSMLDDEITRVTAMMEKWIRDTAAAWFYSGDLFGGEV